MSNTFPWKRDAFAGFICNMPNNVFLVVSPSRTVSRGLKLRAANGSDWLAQCSIWNESTRTMSRFGRDAWRERSATPDEAKRLAESIYREALAALTVEEKTP